MRRWMGLWVGAVLAVFAAALPLESAVAQCPQPPSEARNPTVRLDIIEPRLIYRHDVDLLGLARETRTFEMAPKGGVVLGLTKRSDQLRVQGRWAITRSLDGRSCIWPETVDARIGDPEMDVYVAANYPVGSCEYTVILEHENTHVAINRSVLQAYGQRIGAALRQAVSRMFPIITANPQDANRLPKVLINAVQPQVDAMLEELRRRNGEIDTPESYKRAHERCQNWFPPGTRLPGRG